MANTVRDRAYESFLYMKDLSPEVYYLASNMKYLSEHVDFDDFKFSDLQLFDLAKCIYDHADMSTEPLLNEERLDAVRYILETALRTAVIPPKFWSPANLQ